jgi:PAS domain S-box-containing protein
MKWSVTRKTATLATITIFVMFALGELFYRQISDVLESGGWVAHTQEVLRQMKSTAVVLKDLENKQREYIITGNDSLVTDLRTAVGKLNQSVKDVEALVSDNLQQKEKVALLVKSVDQLGSFTEDIIATRKAEGQIAAWNLLSSEQGKRMVSSVDLHIKDIERTEYALLNIREYTFDRGAIDARRAILILVLLAFAILVVILLVVRSYDRQQRSTEEILRSAAVRFLGIFNQSFESIALLDHEGHVLQVNDTALAKTGALREQLIGRLYWEMPWWKFSKAVQSKLKTAITEALEGKAIRFETQQSTADGSLLDVDFMLKAVKGEQASFDFLIAEIHDLSEVKRTEKALSESEGMLRAIFGSMEEGVYQLDEKGELVFLNPAGARMLGYDPNEILGANMHHLVHRNKTGNSMPLSQCAIFNVINTGVPYQSGDETYKRKDGTLLPVRVLSSPLVVDGEKTGVVVTFEDTTSLKRSERRSSTQYAVTRVFAQFDSIEDASIRVVQTICENLGWELGALWLRSELSNKLKFIRCWHKSELDATDFEAACKRLEAEERKETSHMNAYIENAPLWISHTTDEPHEYFLEAAAQAGLKTAFAFPLRREDECIGVLELYSIQIREPDLELLHMLDALGRQFGQYIERRRMDRMLRENEAKFQQLSNNIKEMFWIANADLSEAIYFSPAFENEWGLSIEEVMKNPREFLRAVAKEDRTRLMDHLQNLPPGGAEIEYRLSTPKKGERWILERTSPIFNEAGSVERVCGIAHDVTERKEMERRVSEFYSTVSHELRTPLTSIRAALGLIEGGLAGEVTQKTAQLIHIARTESDRLIRLINDILDIRKIEAGKLELYLEDLHPEDIVNLSMNGVKAMADEAKVRLSKEVESNDSIKCDRDRMVQVLTNLISNAVKFSPPEQEVIVKVKRNKQSTRFSVCDNGPGIREDQLHKLFGKFQQLDSSDSRPKGGTGLGLAITKAIVEQHGGKIGVDTTPGVGSEFWFEIPDTDVLRLENDDSGLPPEAHTVLVVDDDEQLTEVMKSLLTKDGYRVTTVHTLAKAEEILEKNIPDAILLDVQLPDGNGLDWMKKIRGKNYGKDVPIIVLTGKEPDLHHYGHPRLIDWLTKPFDEKRLFRALQYAVAPEGKRTPKVLVVDDDGPTREVIIHQLKELGVDCLEASDGAQAIHLVRQEQPDLIILDIGLPNPDGYGVVQILRQEQAKTTPLIVYTSRDMTNEDMEKLTLGLTRHLVKSRTSEARFLSAVREVLNGVVSKEEEFALK